MKALIVYSTRYGATKSTAEEIAKILEKNSFETKVVNAKEEKTKDILEFSLVVAGSGMSMGNWGYEAEDFLKKFQGELQNKKVALFISSLKPIEEKEGKTALVEKIKKKGLENKILNYNLKPLSIGLFGGVIDFNKISFLMRKCMEIGYKSALQKHGFRQIEPNCYDLRDWNEIRNWAEDLAKKALI